MENNEQFERRRHAPQSMYGDIAQDIRALNSSILLISQKLQYLVRNEKILGRNLLVLNKKIKDLESGGSGRAAGEGEAGAIPSNVSEQLERLNAQLLELQNSIEEIKRSYVKAEDFKEVKYIVDTISPTEFVTREEIEKMLGSAPEKKKKK